MGARGGRLLHTWVREYQTDHPESPSGFTEPRLVTARGWVERDALAVVLLRLAGSLLRDGPHP